MVTEYVLVKWADNWADEMDLEGFRVYAESEWKEFKTKLSAYKDGFTICVGTNEEIDYTNGKDLLKKMKVIKLSAEDYAVSERLFDGAYGEQSAFDNAPIDEPDSDDGF
jgi:hypothetical protein